MNKIREIFSISILLLIISCQDGEADLARERKIFREIGDNYDLFYGKRSADEKLKVLEVIIELTSETKGVSLDFEYMKALTLARKWVILKKIGREEDLPKVEKVAKKSLKNIRVLEREYSFKELIELVQIMDSKH